MRAPRFLLPLVLLIPLVVLAGCGGDDDGPVTPPDPAQTPLAISNLRVIAGADGSVTLAWTSPPLEDKAVYDLTYALRSVPYGNENLPWEDWSSLAAPSGDTEPWTSREHVVTGLTKGAVYVFQMRAKNEGSDYSGSSNMSVGTASPKYDTTAPAPVTDLAQTGGTTTSLTFRWSTVGGDGDIGHAPHYQVRYAQEPIIEENWEQATFSADISVTGVNSLSHTLTELASETEYWVAVKASDEAGNVSTLSNVPQMTTVDLRVIEVFVDGSGDYRTIDEALTAALAGDLILVGPGRYTWTNQGTGNALTGLINVPSFKDSVELRSTHGAEQTVIDGEEQGKIMAVNGGTVDPPGGERYWTGITIDGFTFTGGVAESGGTGLTSSGGALSLHLTDTVVRNCVFTGNRAIEGGAVWIGGQGAAVLEDCILTGNDADAGGGLILVNSAPMITVRRCEITNNHATYNGGGIGLANCNFLFEDCVIAGNDANQKGGGIYILSMIRDEPAEGIYIEYTGNIDRCTIADNDAPTGSGIHMETIPDLTVTNTIVAYNTGGSAIRNVKVTGMAVGCTDLFGNPGGAAWAGGFTDLGGNIELDPLFCDRTKYGLRSDSPCLAACGQIGARGEGCSP